MKYNNFTIENHSNPESIQDCECMHPSALQGKSWQFRDIGKFMIVLMMYYDIIEREKNRFDTEMCRGISS